jgi:hypothetical protein
MSNFNEYTINDSKVSPKNTYLNEFNSALSLYKSLQAYNETNIGRIARHALSVISDSLRLYGPNNVYSSFNGGKDAVVVMHLFR